MTGNLPDPVIDRIAKAIAYAPSRRSFLAALLTSVGMSKKASPSVRSLAAKGASGRYSYFALGDSIASGHGLLDGDGSACLPDGVTCCHRSARAYPWLVADLLRQTGLDVDFPVAHHIACSSARSLHLPGQIQSVIEFLGSTVDAAPVLISITIGVNDFGWDSAAIIPHFVESDSRFVEWVDTVVKGAREQLAVALPVLFESLPEAQVVLTGYHNPLNRRSFLFRAMGCGALPTRMSCYERTEYAIHALNVALAEIVSSLTVDNSIRFTPDLHDLFHADGGHESPGVGGFRSGAGLCGFSPPGVRDTWIQYPGDPESNSVFAMAGIPNVGGAGDCFHPNGKGAAAYADEVVAGFAGLLSAQTGHEQPGTIFHL